MNPIFPDLPDYDKHPANIGMDFHFDENGISEKVLRNYLSRAQNCNCFLGDLDHTMDDLYMIFKTGAKMVSRATTPWLMGGFEYENYDEIARLIRLAHTADPDLIFENCIFEIVWKSVGEIRIPPETFLAFGLEPEDRCFRYEDMIFEDGRYHWGEDSAVPDLTRMETQLWFYFRACWFIDQGYESLHFGQMMLMCKSDVGFILFDRIIQMVRAYAKNHARRGWVLINAHMYDDRVGDTDRLICDFHMSPTRGLPNVGAVPHIPTEEDPQPIELYVGHFDAQYLDSPGGITPSGWRTDSLPYLIELDNAGFATEYIDIPHFPKQTEWYHGGWWGYDEIGWFSVQPTWYRHWWLRHAWHWIKNIDGNGYCQMPGRRPAAVHTGPNIGDYRHETYIAHVWGDVDAIRQIWVDDRAEQEI